MEMEPDPAEQVSETSWHPEIVVLVRDVKVRLYVKREGCLPDWQSQWVAGDAWLESRADLSATISLSDRMPEYMSERMPGKMSEYMPDTISEYMSDRMPDKISEFMSDRLPDRMPEDMSDRMPTYMPDRI